MPRHKIAVLTASIAAFLAPMASAASLTWDGNGVTAPNPNGATGIWDVNTSLNWWDGTGNVVWPALGGLDDDAIFANTAGTVSLAAGGVTANDLTFSTTGYIIQSNTLTLNGTTPTITTDPGVNATISSVIAGSAGLVKAGPGTLTVTGTSTYTGGTTISAGTFELGNGTTNGVVAGAITNNAALSFRNATAQTVSNVISGTGTVTKTGSLALTLSGASSYSGATSITNGLLIATSIAPNGTNSSIGTGTSLMLDGGTLRYTGAQVGTSANVSTHFNRNITVGAGGGALDIAGTGIVFYNGTLTGTGNLAILDTSGDANNRQVLYTGNSPAFAGTVSIGNGSPNSGWLQYRSNAASPFGSATITINAGGILSADGGVTAPTALANNLVFNGGTMASQGTATVYGGNVTVNPVTSFLQPNGTQSLILAGAITGAGTLQVTTGTSAVDLRGNNAGFTGTYNQVAAGATIFTTAASASAGASWNIPNGAAASRFVAAGVDGTYRLGALSGTTGRVENLNAAAGNSTFEVGALNTNTTFAGTIVTGGGGTVALTKVGTGSLTLSGANTYTGPTNVNNGVLLLNNGSLSTSSVVTAAAGTTFGGRGAAGAVTTSGTLQGGVADAGSLSLTALTFTGSSVVNLMPVTGTTASVAVSGVVTTSGTQTLNITNSAPLTSGSYRLVSYSSLGGAGIDAFTLGTTPALTPGFRNRTYTLDKTTSPASYVALTVFADAPVWTGENNSNWDTTTTGNWKLASDNTTPTTFFTGDAVQFNDTANRNVTISGTNVAPVSVAFNNSTGNDYTLTGSNGIAGTGSLTKAGNGTLTIANTHTYTGGTTVTAGTLELGDGTTNGTIAGTIANTGTVSFRNATAQTFTNVISGTGGTILKNGGAPVTLSAASTFSGTVSISGGGILVASTLAPNATNSSLGTGGSLVIDGGTFRYAGASLGNNTLTTQFNRALTVGAGGATLDNGGTGFLFYNGTISGPGNLSFIDSSGDGNNQQWLLTSNNPGLTGNVTIGTGAANSGWLQYRSNAAAPLGTGTVTVNTGGIYSTDGGATAPLATIPNNFILNGGKLQSQNAACGFAGTITVNTGTTSFLQADNTSNIVFNNSIIGSGTLTQSTAAGAGSSVELRGNNSGFTGIYNHSGPGATVFFTAASANAAATWNIPSGANATARFAAGGTNLTYQLGALSGVGGRVENFNAAAGNSVFEVGALNTNTSFAGIFANGAGGTVALTKVGTGTLTLSGLSTATGPTTVSNGILLLNGGGLSTAGTVNVAAGTTFGGKGAAGATTVSSGATLQGGIANAGSLALTSLVFGGNSNLNVMPVTGSTASVAVSGNVTTSGTQTINITSSLPLPGGTYRLISYGTIDGAGIGAFVLGSIPAAVPGARPRVYNLDTTTAPASYVGLTVISDSPIWTGTNNGNWDTTTTDNWVLASNGTTPTTYFAADAVQFNDTTGNRNLVISSGDVAPSSVVFNHSAGNDYKISGANGITGATLLQKSGAGTLTIANTNTYTGDTTVSGGTLQFGDGTTNGSIPGNIINTAAVRFNSLTTQTHAGNITGTGGTLTKVGPGTLVLTGANTYTGGTTITEGTLQIGNGTVNGSIGTGTYSIAAGTTLFLNYAAAAAPTWANFSGAGTIELNSAQAVNGSANWTPTTAIALPAGFTGTLQVDRGRIHGTPANLGGATALAFGNGAQFLAFDGNVLGIAYTFNQNFSIAGMGWGENGYEFGALRNSGMNATFTGSITLTGNSGLYNQGASNATSTFTGVISDGGSGFNLAINAASNSITLSNPGNSYGGNTTVDLGILRLGAANVIPDGAGKGNVVVTTTFDLNTFSETINGLSGAGFVDTIAGGAPVLTVGNNDATSTFTGVIRNTAGSLGLTKIGAGTLTLSGTNTYTGTTTVSAGTLIVNGSISGSTVIVDGGTLAGSGTAGATTVNAAGTLAPGPSIATLNFSTLTLGGIAAFEIGKSGVTLTADRANVTGALTLGGILNVTASGDTLFPGDTFNLFDAGGFSGSFTAMNLPPLSDPGYSWDTTNIGTDGTLTVVPEPGTILSLIGGLGLLLGLRRRRSS